MGSVTAAASTGSSMALFLKASTAMASLRVEALSLLRMAPQRLDDGRMDSQ